MFDGPVVLSQKRDHLWKQVGAFSLTDHLEDMGEEEGASLDSGCGRKNTQQQAEMSVRPANRQGEQKKEGEGQKERRKNRQMHRERHEQGFQPGIIQILMERLMEVTCLFFNSQ